jgi:hypothetical protein
MKDMREDGTLPQDKGISTKTVCFFLRYLDMELVEPKKGIYKDGLYPALCLHHLHRLGWLCSSP